MIVESSAIPTTVCIASGKGGVGKTQVSVDLARALVANGHTVGFFDADISTPNAPEALAGEDFDYSGQQKADRSAEGDRRLRPVEADGIHVFSQGLHLRDDVAYLKGGQYRSEAVMQYLGTIDWPDDTEYLIVDSPPGNGNEIQSVLATAAPEYAYIVTTKDTHSARDARRTRELMVQAELDHGVIVNMATFSHSQNWGPFEEAIQEIHGIGRAKAEQVVGIAKDHLSVEELPLHDDGVDVAERVGAEVLADVPFTTDEETRQAALQPAIDALPEPVVVA